MFPWQTARQQSEFIWHEEPVRCVPPPAAQHEPRFVLQLLLQQSEFRRHWSPTFGEQLPPEELPLLPPPEELPPPDDAPPVQVADCDA